MCVAPFFVECLAVVFSCFPLLAFSVPTDQEFFDFGPGVVVVIELPAEFVAGAQGVDLPGEVAHVVPVLFGDLGFEFVLLLCELRAG